MKTLQTNYNLFRLNFINKITPVFIARVLPIIVLLIVSILYSRSLSYSDYGRFQTFWIYTNVINISIAFGLPSIILSNRIVVLNFFFKKNKYYILIFYSLLLLLIGIIFFMIQNNFDTNIKIKILLLSLIQFISSISDSLFIKKQKLRFYFFINFFYTCFLLSILLYYYYTPFNIRGIINGLIVIGICKSLFIFFVLNKNENSYTSTAQQIFTKNWFYIGINDVVGVIARWLDKIFLLTLISSANFAVFINGTLEIPLFAILISSIEAMMLIKISRNIGDKKNVINVFRESFKLISIISFPLFFMLLTIHGELFSLLFNNKYNQSIPIFLISILIIPARINHYTVILQCYNKGQKILLGSIIDIFIALILMYFLYPIFGLNGVAASIVISTYVQIFFYLWYSSNIINTKILNLIPIKYLSFLFTGLAFIYAIFFFLKPYFSIKTNFIALLLFTFVIIIYGLYKFLFLNKKIK